jgi:hypothetical protein
MTAAALMCTNFSSPGTRSARRKATRRPAAQVAELGLEELSRGEAHERQQERLLEQIAEGAKLCQEVELQIKNHPVPALDTLIRLHRVLVLKLSLEAQAAPELFQLVSRLMKPVIDWARLEEKQKDRELAEQKYKDQVAAQKAAKEKDPCGRGAALSPETLERIERELHLF